MKFDRIPMRSLAPIAASACAVALLSGCMSSPTYGTGKTANAQLLEDVTGVLAIGTGSNKEPEIAYTPRGQLVRPASLEVLPEPQQEIAAAGNPAWPESPEERRRRLRAEATENQDNPSYRSPIVTSARASDTAFVTDAQRAEIQRLRRESNQGDANYRRYLSEPPLEYRTPEATAAAGELGEDEFRKANRAKRAAGKSSWRDFVPWL